MGLKSFKPTSAARRYYSVSDFAEITKSEPERSLLEHQSSTGGRNHHGRVTSRFRAAATSSATDSSIFVEKRWGFPPR